jgi:ABC-type antimicrobial peptide transport system permease subunit
VIGAGAGFVIALVWALAHSWALVISPLLLPAPIGGGTLAAIVGGLLPARRAAAISPLTAMRT